MEIFIVNRVLMIQQIYYFLSVKKMKKLTITILLVLCYANLFSQPVYSYQDFDDSKEYILENKQSLFYLYDVNDKCYISLSEPIDSLIKKFGNPEKITETKAHPSLRDEYITVRLEYQDFIIKYWKGYPCVRYMEVKNDKCYISEKKIRIQNASIAELLELYQELEVYDYKISNDESGRQILRITFRTVDKTFLSEYAKQDDYYCITYEFDYKKKLCIGAWMMVYDD